MVIGPKNNVFRHISANSNRKVVSEDSMEAKFNRLTDDENDVIITLQGGGLDPDYHIWSLDQKSTFSGISQLLAE